MHHIREEKKRQEKSRMRETRMVNENSFLLIIASFYIYTVNFFRVTLILYVLILQLTT